MKNEIEPVDCSVCGEEIPLGRLKIFPKTKSCVECITSGKAKEEVFAKKARMVMDEEGNLHTDILSTPKDWENAKRDRKSLGTY